VEDDGQASTRRVPPGLWLVGLNERARLISGRPGAGSDVGKGTRVK
jgi:hypothetical protein